MDNPLIVLLENSGLIDKGKPIQKNLRKIKKEDIIKLTEQADEITSFDKIKVEPSLFRHSASTTLGAGSFPCSYIDCRMQKAIELSQFAALYSDKVYIRNFLHDHIRQIEKGTLPIDQVIEAFRFDITILATLAPLIESGKIELVTYTGFCPHCLTVKALNLSSPKALKQELLKLTNRYYKEAEYILEYEKDIDTFILASKGPESLIPHGGPYQHDITKQILSTMPSLADKAKKLGQIKLTTSQARMLKLGEDYPNSLIYSASFELGGSYFLKTSYLSDNELEIDLIRDLTSDPIAKRHSSIMQKHLMCLLPFIKDVNASDLIKLRETEGESFQSFRIALTKAIEEFKIQGDHFRERDAQAIYSDIIYPKLSNLDSKMKAASRKLVKDSRRRIISWSAAITVGMYTGMIPTNLLGIGAAIGAKKLVDIFDEIISKSDVEESIRDDEWYFLWRVKKTSEGDNLTAQPRHYSF
jgi:hypothetical protein